MRRRQIQGHPTPYHFEWRAPLWHNQSDACALLAPVLTEFYYFPTVIVGDAYTDAGSTSASLSECLYFAPIIDASQTETGQRPAAALTEFNYFDTLLTGDAQTETSQRPAATLSAFLYARVVVVGHAITETPAALTAQLNQFAYSHI